MEKAKASLIFCSLKMTYFFCLKTCRKKETSFFLLIVLHFYETVMVLLLLLILPRILEVLSAIFFFKYSIFSLSIDFDPFVNFFTFKKSLLFGN